MGNELAKASGAIRKAKVIGLMTHVRGDGDAFGSLLALRNIIEKLNKRTVIFSDEALPGYLTYLKTGARYKPTRFFAKVDLLIILDVASKNRMTVPAVFDRCTKRDIETLLIDHHAEGDIYGECDLVWRKTDTSSTAEMVYWLARELNVALDNVTAQYLLWGIDTDTYFLSNPNVFPSTNEAREELLKVGAKNEEIRENLKATSPTANADFLGMITGRAKIDAGNNIMGSYITLKDLKKFGYKPGSSSTIANYLDYHNDSKIVLVAEQRTPDIIKVSMRSNKSKANVASLSSYFGGGGHVKAAGFEVRGRLEDLLKK